MFSKLNGITLKGFKVIKRKQLKLKLQRYIIQLNEGGNLELFSVNFQHDDFTKFHEIIFNSFDFIERTGFQN